MPAASSGGADNQALATFDRYPDLPAEMRIKIIRAFIANWRVANTSSEYGTQNLAPFAALHSEWQQELEPQRELWGSLSLTADDLPTYRLMLSKLRHDSLSEVTLWISIEDNVIAPDEQSRHLISPSDIKSRACEFVVHSVSTLLECVDYPSSMWPQPHRKGVQFHTKITCSDIIGLGIYKLDCDFSRIPIANAICTFSQGQHVRRPRWATRSRPTGGLVSVIQRIEESLFLNQSSLLSLFSRLPNLEDAYVRLDRFELIAPVATSDSGDSTQVSNCPRIKGLSLWHTYSPVGRYQQSILGKSLPWVSNWSQSIERLTLGDVNIAGFLRSLSALRHSTGMITWPNLQVLHAGGFYPQEGGNVEDVLSTVPAALVVLPGIRDIKVTQHRISDFNLSPSIVTELTLRGESSKLTVSFRPAGPIDFRQWRFRISMGWRGRDMDPPHFWKLFSQYRVTKLAAAVADIQAAVSKQHGHDLKVTLPERDDDPEVAINNVPQSTAQG